MAILEKGQEGESILLTDVLDHLAYIYDYQDKKAEAESLLERALTVYERIQGPEHPQVAATLNNLATLYMEQHRYADAEPLLQRSLASAPRSDCGLRRD